MGESVEKNNYLEILQSNDQYLLSEYLIAKGKSPKPISPIMFINKENEGYHEDGVGWNPHGVFCGECSWSSCLDCPMKDKEE